MLKQPVQTFGYRLSVHGFQISMVHTAVSKAGKERRKTGIDLHIPEGGLLPVVCGKLKNPSDFFRIDAFEGIAVYQNRVI